MAFDPREVLNFYQRLSPRERWLLSLALGSLITVSLYTFVWDPLTTGRGDFVARIGAKERELVEIQEMRSRYLELLRQLEASQTVLVKTDDTFSLFKHLDAAVTEVLTRDKVAAMNPSERNLTEEYQEEAVEIRLNGISLDQLVNVLHRIEKAEPQLRVSRLLVKKRHNEPYSFDVTATVSLLKERSAPAQPAGSPAVGVS